MSLARKRRFVLPVQEVFQANNDDDPLPYYYKPIIGRIFRERIEQGLSLLQPPYGSILEIGFGSGLVLPSLCRLGEQVYGIDLNSDPAKVGEDLQKMGCNCHLYQGDISKSTFENEQFDLIVAFSVLEHIQDLDYLVQHVQRFLSPGGHFLVGMPRVDRFMSKAFEFVGFNEIDKHHVSDYAKCLGACSGAFSLHSRTRLPQYLPQWASLYNNMLFEKK
jgi:2-polyprenyl-3-methyl-5-hydroxy-6-metoxy-1,4-benzoquinol methylase